MLAACASAHAQSLHEAPTRQEVAEAGRGTTGSPYIPLDSWIYPAVLRLHDLGYLPTFYVGMLPYTRASLSHALRLSQGDIRLDEEDFGDKDEAVEIYGRLARELAPELNGTSGSEQVIESAYARLRQAGGFVINDSFHVGQSFVNDYGRPYQHGSNGIAGASGYATRGRFNLYVRGEYQHAPSGQGYSPALVQALTEEDTLTPGYHSIIPQGTIAGADQFRLLGAEVSAHVLGHQIAFGKNDEWLGPAHGGSFAWSINAEPNYAFRIDRVEPIYFPFLSRFTGPFRYEFFVGSLKGHDTPNDPWVHVEKASFQPTPNIEFGFERTVIWGGKNHVPITIGTFVRSFVSPAGVDLNVKFSRNDPGARFSTFDFNYRMPWKDHLLTIYADSFVHDNVFPVSNPGRAAIRPGIAVNRLAYLDHVDFRAEGAYTDLPDINSVGGTFLYFEGVQKNGYTNRNFIMGDPIGREAKGGNAWLTWHRRPDQDIQLEYRAFKAAKDLVPLGTTQQDLALNVRLRPTADLEIKGQLQGEVFRGPAVVTNSQHSVSATLQLTWYPNRSR